MLTLDWPIESSLQDSKFSKRCSNNFKLFGVTFDRPTSSSTTSKKDTAVSCSPDGDQKYFMLFGAKIIPVTSTENEDQQASRSDSVCASASVETSGTNQRERVFDDKTVHHAENPPRKECTDDDDQQRENSSESVNIIPVQVLQCPELSESSIIGAVTVGTVQGNEIVNHHATTPVNKGSSVKRKREEEKPERRKKPSKAHTQRLEKMTENNGLPDDFLSKVQALNNSEEVVPLLLLNKYVFRSDINPVEQRLMMSQAQVKHTFLNDSEYLTFHGTGEMKVKVIYKKVTEVEGGENKEEIEEGMMELARWPKPGGEKAAAKEDDDQQQKMKITKWCYALQKDWIKVVDASKIKEDGVVQVWSFRYGKDQKLGLAVVKAL